MKRKILGLTTIVMSLAIVFAGCVTDEGSPTQTADTTEKKATATVSTTTAGTPKVTTAVPKTATATITPSPTPNANVPAGKVNVALNAEVTASSTVENADWSIEFVIDESEDTRGYSSNNELGNDHAEYIQFEFAEAKISQVNIFPRQDIDDTQDPDDPLDMLGDGYPKDFTIEVSMDGETWTAVKKIENAPKPTSKDAIVYSFNEVSAKFLKINATSLNEIENDRGNYRMQFFEIAIYGDKK